MIKKGFITLLTAVVLGTTLTALCACGSDGNDGDAAKISVTVVDSVYDGTAKEASVSVSPQDAGELTVVYKQNGTEVSECVNAGVYTVSVSLRSDTYEAQSVEKTFTISPKPITVSGITIEDKYADGSTSVDYTGTPELQGIISGDEVTITSFSLAAESANYGVHKNVNVTVVFGGSAAENYSLQESAFTVNFYPVTADFKFLPVIENEQAVAYTVAEFVGTGTEIIVPNSFGGLPVSEISENCFCGSASLTKVTFSPNVAVNVAAFEGCSALTSVILADIGFEFRPTFEDGEIVNFSAVGFGGMGAGETVAVPSSVGGAPVTELADHLFAGNGLVVSLTIPASVTKIGVALAQNATSLKNVFFEDREETIVWGADTFGSWTFVGSSVEKIEIGNGISEIPAIFATGAAQLSSVVLGSDIIVIGNEAFKNCTSLSQIALPDNLTDIRNDAFRSSGLQSITIPSKVTAVGTAVFQGCASLTEVVFEDREDTIVWAVDALGSWIFFECSALREITIGEGITSLPAIFAPSSAVTVSIGKDVAQLGSESFPNSKSVTTIYLDSQTILNALNTYVFFENVATVYLAEGLTVTEYLTQNFTAGETENGYTVYTKN